eukprot:3809323-Karenia_brevis.AAC.1
MWPRTDFFERSAPDISTTIVSACKPIIILPISCLAIPIHSTVSIDTPHGSAPIAELQAQCPMVLASSLDGLPRNEYLHRPPAAIST